MKSRWTEHGLAAAVAIVLTVVRSWGVSRHFWMFTDQIRDWSVALLPLWRLPLVGSPTHVHGYTIGPAFYWLLWLIRVTVGPWFQNLPHGGGIGQALLQSAVDGLLLVAIWRRTQSVWLALAAIVLLTTGALELSLAAIIWNPIGGEILAKAAIALVLLEWHRASLPRVAIVAAIAWSAVHAYTGAVFVALSVFVALVADECLRHDWRAASRRVAAIAAAVTALQIPWIVHQVATRYEDSGMSAVAWSFGEFFNGPVSRLQASIAGYFDACRDLQAMPWSASWLPAILVVCAVLVAVRYRRDPVLLSLTVLPPIATIAGYALWRGDLQSYYYFSLMLPAVLTVLLGVTSFVPARAMTPVALLLLLGALALVPARLRTAETMNKMPEYAALVDGSREIARRGEPVQSVRTEFPLKPFSDPEFLCVILGTRFERGAAFRAVIRADGRVLYLPALESRR
jgi:hypothetical protein